MSLVRIAEPAVEPLTIAAVEEHLRMDSTNKEPSPDAPTVALANPAAPGNVNAGAHRWRATFVTADGETDGGQISASLTVANAAVNGQIALSNIPLGGAAVTARKLYRTKAGLDDFFLVATIANNTATAFTDNVADTALGVGCPTTNTTTSPLLAGFIQTARETVEEAVTHALITQTWRLTLDRFPRDRDYIELGMPPVQSIAAFTYVNDAGNVVAFTDYTLDVDSFPGRVVLNYSKAWPATRAQRNAVVIEFVAGFGDARADIPRSLTTAMSMLVSHYWNHRGAVDDPAFAEIPLGVAALLGGRRRPAMAMA